MNKQQALAFVAALLTSVSAMAQVQAPPQPANEQVIVPQVERRELKIPKFPSKDFEVNLFAGTYATQNFGTSAVTGLKLGYYITEDVFVQTAFGRTNVSDEDFRIILPTGFFTEPKRKLSYYNVSVGYNILPGEIFIGRNIAKASAFYVIGGIGSTSVGFSRTNQKAQTLNAGFGFRVLFTDRMALQLDVRDHIFTVDLLGKRDSTQNIELTGGFSYFF